MIFFKSCQQGAGVQGEKSGENRVKYAKNSTLPDTAQFGGAPPTPK
jgi:hypothetical protein